MRRIIIMLSVVIITCSVAIAQPDDPSTDPDDVPLGGIEFLLLAGGALGIKTLMQRRKKDSA